MSASALPTAAAIGIVLLALAPPCAAAGAHPDTASIHGLWRMQVGQAPTSAAPGHDASAWQVVGLPASWVELDLQGVEGTVWFRNEVTLAEHQIALAEGGDLGLLLGECVFGAYEVFAGGELVGRSPGWSLPLATPSPAAFNIPAAAVEEPGRLVLALRARRVGWASDRTEGGPFGSRIRLASFGALAKEVEADELRLKVGDTPYLILAFLFLGVAVYHLHLYHRRRQRTEYLWFALTSLFFAANTFLISSWTMAVTSRADLILRWTSASGHLAAAASIQFLWPFLSKPIPRLLRAYQISHAVIALLVITVPATSLVVDTSGIRMLYLVPLILLVAYLVISETLRGNPEARTIGLGCLAVVVAEGHQVAVTVFGEALELPLSLPAIGFAVAVGSMAVSISNRFHRVHSELDALRLHLEEMVRQRTTDLRAAVREAEAANAVKTEFLANVSHELRTPLNIIIGMTEVLRDGDLDDHGHDCAEDILASSRDLLGLITDVLDFTAIDAGTVTIDRTVFNPERILEASVQAIAGAAQAKGLSLDTHVDEEVPTSFFGDPGQIRRILVHLLGNGVKFTDEGHVRATLSARNNGTDRMELCFAVSDTGIGIEEGDQGSLFELFRQVDGSLTRRHGGTGIGLALCHQLADLMGGRIWFETGIGTGSTFFLAVPGEVHSARD